MYVYVRIDGCICTYIYVYIYVHIRIDTDWLIGARGRKVWDLRAQETPLLIFKCGRHGVAAGMWHTQDSQGKIMAFALDLSGRITTRAEDAQGTPTQSHISPSILVYEDKMFLRCCLFARDAGLGLAGPANPPPDAQVRAPRRIYAHIRYVYIRLYVYIRIYG